MHNLEWLGLGVLLLGCSGGNGPPAADQVTSAVTADAPACGTGDPSDPPTDEGYEAIFGKDVVGVCRQALGCSTSWASTTPNTADEAVGTPNQRLLWRVWYYGWAYRHGSIAQQADARAQLLAFLETQDRYGHEAIAETGYDANEILTGSHYEIWSNGMTCARLVSYLHQDQAVLSATAKWWRGEAALYRLLVRGGTIDAPGARYFPGQTGGSNQLRDVVYDMIFDAPLPSPANRSTGPWWSEYYNVAAWTLRELFKAGDNLGAARDVTNADLPALRDPLRVYTRGEDWVFEFPSMRGALDPLFWVASVNGVKTYAPVVAGNPATSSVPAPVLTGASLVIVPGTP
jgi:hypothetical protein